MTSCMPCTFLNHRRFRQITEFPVFYRVFCSFQSVLFRLISCRFFVETCSFRGKLTTKFHEIPTPVSADKQPPGCSHGLLNSLTPNRLTKLTKPQTNHPANLPASTTGNSQNDARITRPQPLQAFRLRISVDAVPCPDVSSPSPRAAAGQSKQTLTTGD